MTHLVDLAAVMPFPAEMPFSISHALNISVYLPTVAAATV